MCDSSHSVINNDRNPIMRIMTLWLFAESCSPLCDSNKLIEKLAEFKQNGLFLIYIGLAGREEKGKKDGEKHERTALMIMDGRQSANGVEPQAQTTCGSSKT